MKQIKNFWNQKNLIDAINEVKMARRVYKEVSDVLDKKKIPTHLLEDICNAEWELIRQLIFGIHFNDEETCRREYDAGVFQDTVWDFISDIETSYYLIDGECE